ncbi:AI-2E family transporter [Candidatus Magnetaquicoccus inordinatus]|uniref:AI-2E family transporter n=1 Tax=Candidatus Magnetaquicoccus inordinatus TaxID=2496818 RepID=UPI00187D464A|nr:AI-2E family transporter [Candidatus Magnetaquicoccus inordinatus]
MSNDSQHPNDQMPLLFQEGFLAILLLLAIVGLFWLMLPFLPGLCLATVLAASTYPLYQKIQLRFALSAQGSALLMTGSVFFLVISPVVYLLTIAGIEIARFFSGLKQRVALLSPGELQLLRERLLERLPLPVDLQEILFEQFESMLQQMVGMIKNVSLFLFQNILGNFASFFSSLLLILLALFFLYRDGPALLRQLQILSPLPNRLDQFIMRRFALLATVLTLSTLSIALIQGVSIAVVALFMGLPWFTLGVAVAVTSFVPVLGSMLVWGPTVYWLIAHDQWLSGMFLLFWGGVVNGFLVDNLLRPLLINRFVRMSRSGAENDDESSPLDHTLLTVLSTFGGLLAFGIMGLFFGPLIAAMAITIFEIYEREYGHRLDYS